ncbi:MAG: carbohydrate ABC transporter substrate-binding protein [Lachnospiraceae bacterium]|nr:carbohydrate ABC transporter substrate-binding protein [Lachnospiraceae bacterium]
MRKNLIITRAAAFLMSAVIGVTAAGCGTQAKRSEYETDLLVIDNDLSAAQQDHLDNNGTGRYVERTVCEGDYWDRVEKQTLSDGQIVFVNSMTSQRFVSKDGGDTWDIEQNESFAAFVKEHYPISTALSKDGTLALICMDKKDASADIEQMEYVYRLYIYYTDHTVKQIEIDLPDAESSLSEAAFDEQGGLFVYASGCRIIYKVDINTETVKKLTILQESCYLMECRNDILMCMAAQKIFLYDLEKEQFIEDETLDSFIMDTYQDLSWTGAGFTAYSFLGEDKTIYIAGDKGLHRHVIGGSTIEQVMDGSLTMLSTPSHSILAMTLNDSNEFLTVYSDGIIVKAAYDAKVPTVPNEKLTVYSLYDNDMVKQTISAYQTQYPEMFIEYQVGLEDGSITREDALKKLNTQLLGGSGPDIMLLDGMNIDAYTEKGVLMELSNIVNEAEEKDGLYKNLIESLSEDDNIYAIPLEFHIPVVIGQKNVVDSITDYRSMVELFEKAREEYTDTDILGISSAKGIMKRAMPICAPSWRDGKALDAQKVKEFLALSKRLYEIQMNGTPAEAIANYQRRVSADDTANFENSPYFKGLNEGICLERRCSFAFGETLGAYTYRDMLSVPRVEGMEQVIYKPLDGQSTKVYHPESIVGINAATESIDRAQQFVALMLSTTVQDHTPSGFPINKKSLASTFAYNENKLDENGGQYSTSYTIDGVNYRFTIYPVNQDGIDLLEQWIAGFDTPYLSDAALENVVYAQGVEYIEGRKELDEAVDEIVNSVEIYLAE